MSGRVIVSECERERESLVLGLSLRQRPIGSKERESVCVLCDAPCCPH